MDQSFTMARIYLGQAYMSSRMYLDAISEFEKSLDAGSTDVKGYLGLVLVLSGFQHDAEEILGFAALPKQANAMCRLITWRHFAKLSAIAIRHLRGWKKRSTREAGMSPI